MAAMHTRLTFENFEVDLRRRRLTRGGRAVRLQPQPFALLELLISRPGRTVTRAEMHRALWPHDTHVAFDTGLNTAMRKLRRALGDSAEHPRCVITMPGVGYRFIAELSPVDDVPSVDPRDAVVTQASDVNAPVADVPRHLAWLRAVACAAALAAMIEIPGGQPGMAPEAWRAHVARAHARFAASDAAGAVVEFERAVAEGAHEDAVFVDYACALADLEQPDAALAVIERGLRRRPQSVTLRAHRGLRLHAVGRYDEELAALTDAVALDPRSADAQFHLGLGFARRQHYGASLAALQLAVDLSGGAPYYLSWLGRIAADAGRVTDAETALRTLQRHATTTPVAKSLIDAVAYHLAVARS